MLIPGGYRGSVDLFLNGWWYRAIRTQCSNSPNRDGSARTLHGFTDKGRPPCAVLYSKRTGKQMGSTHTQVCLLLLFPMLPWPK